MSDPTRRRHSHSLVSAARCTRLRGSEVSRARVTYIGRSCDRFSLHRQSLWDSRGRPRSPRNNVCRYDQCSRTRSGSRGRTNTSGCTSHQASTCRRYSTSRLIPHSHHRPRKWQRRVSRPALQSAVSLRRPRMPPTVRSRPSRSRTSWFRPSEPIKQLSCIPMLSTAWVTRKVTTDDGVRPPVVTRADVRAAESVAGTLHNRNSRPSSIRCSTKLRLP